MTSERTLDDLVSTLKNVVANHKKCTLLIGAGCSVTVGIPTAAGFMDEIRERDPRACQRATQKTYPHCMAELPPGARRDLIAELVDRARINWAHIAIAQLMKHGFVDRVLTVNFDPLVVRARALLGEFPAVYDLASSQLFKPADIPDQAVFYLHGQRSGFRLLHTQQEVEKHAKALAPVFEDAGRSRMWIVVGYSGEQDPVFGHLAAVPQFDNGLYWITHKDKEPASQVRKDLLRTDNYAFYIKGHDADGFFERLAQALACFPPDFIGKPFSHLNRMLELIAPIDPPGETANMAIMARGLIDSAIAHYEKGAEPTPLEQDAEHRRSQRSAVAAQEQFLAGDYGKASEIAAKVPGEETKELDVWAHLMEGNDLYGKARIKSGAEADRLFTATGEKYQKALAIKPDLHQAFYNWGSALLDQARTKRGTEADSLYGSAAEKLFRAEELVPGHAVYNLACLAAVQDREEEALSRLVKAREAGTLPDRAQLDQDPDLESIRNTDRFQAFLAGLSA